MTPPVLMEVKGTAVGATPKFIEATFGAEGLERWRSALPHASGEIFANEVLTVVWYPLHDAFALPTRVMCDLFFAGDPRGAEEVGRFSADLGLRGVYKVFIRLGSPGWSIDRASKAFGSYYRPATVEVTDRTKTQLRMTISDLVDSTGMVERRITGWCVRALEIIGVSDIQVHLEKSLSAGDSQFQAVISWK